MKYIIASVLLLILLLHICRKIANAITKGIVFFKPFIQLISGLTWGIVVAFLVVASIHFTHAGLVLKIIWYLGGCYMAYVSFGHDQKVMDAMSIANGKSVFTYIAASVGIYFLRPLVLPA